VTASANIPSPDRDLAALLDRAEKLLESGSVAEATDVASRAAGAVPANSRAWFLLGTALHRAGRLAEAVPALERSLQIDPSSAIAHHNLAAVLLALDRFADCERESRAALQWMPGLAEAGVNLAVALFALGRLEESESALRSLIRSRPATVQAHFNLALLLMKTWRADEALPYALTAARLAPQWADAHGIAGELLGHLSRFREAATALDHAVALAPGQARWRVIRALLMPIIPESTAQIEASRADLRRRVAGISESGLRLDDPAADIGMTTFYAAYQVECNAALQKEVALMYERLCPDLLWRAPACVPRSRAGRRLRVGILSACLYEHTVGRLTRGIIEQMDRERFEVVVLRADASYAGAAPADAIATAIDAVADDVVRLPRALTRAREIVAAQRLDVLFFPDIGMSPFVTFLAYARLAPVQAVTWGHPDTTGLRNMDYFVSSSLIEPPDADSHYTERLVRLSRLPAYYAKPLPPAATGLRDRLALPAGSRLYACPQSLFKFHPDFDTVLARLLETDPAAHLVLVSSRFASWNAALRVRLQAVAGAGVDRVRFVEYLPQHEFLELLSVADAVLDPPGFGGGNSSYEALGIGVPVVTMPGAFMRGRVTLGCYRQMGFEELIAGSAEQYVEIAVRLASDAGFRERCRARIMEGAHRLFEDATAVRELEAFFETAVDDAAAGALGP
jgi:predicted O-linked N-acetylglucosamine transferase (SPINDLY family)